MHKPLGSIQRRPVAENEGDRDNWRTLDLGLTPEPICLPDYFAHPVQDDNAGLKRIVTDLTLDKAMIQDVLQKALRPSARPPAFA